ncbi:MAG: M15 family metallopeptidase [Treponema sp.]|nr:M15 family metallopeptidase [Treponema sp.]
MKKRASPIIILIFLLIFRITAQEAPKMGIGNLKYLEKAYPDLTFTRRYDKVMQDWLITVKIPDTPGDKGGKGHSEEFYWANGSMLPESEIKNADKYWPILYGYQKELSDPANFTEEERERIKQFSSTENRQNGAGTPMFFFDALYDSSSRARLESHIKRISFLGNLTNVHERMIEPLGRVEKRIYALAESNEEVKSFLANLKSNDAYYWRIIAGTKRKSFHSLGIAVDVLPKKLGGKQIFWSWARDKYPNTWMLIPLKDRWMPPAAVIRIFEEEGFIWGGKWVIYDNMHFEYHPELIQFNFYK